MLFNALFKFSGDTYLNQVPSDNFEFCKWYLNQLQKQVNNVAIDLCLQNFYEDEYKRMLYKSKNHYRLISIFRIYTRLS